MFWGKVDGEIVGNIVNVGAAVVVINVEVEVIGATVDVEGKRDEIEVGGVGVNVEKAVEGNVDGGIVGDKAGVKVEESNAIDKFPWADVYEEVLGGNVDVGVA